MIRPRLTHVLAASALATTLAGGIATPAQAMPLPVTSAHEIAGAAPTEHVQWWGWRRAGWGGYGWGWRRPYYGGGALAAGLVGGLALGTLAASAGSYYGYGYPAYYGYGYPYYSYGYPYYGYGYSRAYYSYPAYYGGYGWGGGYWASGRTAHRHAPRHARR